MFESVWARHGYGQSALIERATDRVIGRAGLHYWSAWHEIELGYLLARDRQGLGLAREAATAWVDWSWRNLSVDHLIAVIEPGNDASVRLAEHLGFTRSRLDFTSPGVAVDVFALARPRERLDA